MLSLANKNWISKYKADDQLCPCKWHRRKTTNVSCQSSTSSVEGHGTVQQQRIWVPMYNFTGIDCDWYLDSNWKENQEDAIGVPLECQWQNNSSMNEGGYSMWTPAVVFSDNNFNSTLVQGYTNNEHIRYTWPDVFAILICKELRMCHRHIIQATVCNTFIWWKQRYCWLATTDDFT